MVAQATEAGAMIPPALGRFIRYWYTYRTVVAVLLGILVSGSMYWLYTQQVACDNQDPSCTIRLSLHPEDRLFFESSNPNIVLVGIDDARSSRRWRSSCRAVM